jgi:hypothetical protein
MRQASRCESERTTRTASVDVGRAQPGACRVSVYATSGRRVARTLACCDARGRLALVALPRGTTRRLEDALVKLRMRWDAGDRTPRSTGEGRDGGVLAADVAGGAAGGAQDQVHQLQVTVCIGVIPWSGSVDARLLSSRPLRWCDMDDGTQRARASAQGWWAREGCEWLHSASPPSSRAASRLGQRSFSPHRRGSWWGCGDPDSGRAGPSAGSGCAGVRAHRS